MLGNTATISGTPVITADYSPALTTIRVTEADGTIYTFTDAFVVGMWSKQLVINSYLKKNMIGEKVMGGEVQSSFFNLNEIDRVEMDVEDDYSHTREELEGPGHLGFDDEVDIDGTRTTEFLNSGGDYNTVANNSSGVFDS